MLRSDFFFGPLKFSVDGEFSLMALDCYCHSRNTNSRCLRTAMELYGNKKKNCLHIKNIMRVPPDLSMYWLVKVGSEKLWHSLGFACFPLGEELVSACSGASECAELWFRGVPALWSVGRIHWATAATDEVWFECWAEKKIDGMVNIDSSKSTSKGWLLSLCWHMCYGCRFMLVR